MEVEKVNVLGVRISVLDQDRAQEFLLMPCAGRQGYVALTGLCGVTEAQDDAVLRDIFNRALCVTPDRMPIVWVEKLQGVRQ